MIDKHDSTNYIQLKNIEYDYKESLFAHYARKVSHSARSWPEITAKHQSDCLYNSLTT